jgi:hypothetical protein
MAISQSVETSNSIPLSGKTITFSFYARKGANYSATSNILEAAVFSGTGTDQSITSGFTGQSTLLNTTVTLTTSWQRFTYSMAVPATSKQLAVRFIGTPTGTAGAADYYEITGMQIEAGSIATPFTRAATTLQGELAACQRYYQRFTGTWQASGAAGDATNVYASYPLVAMRTTPTAIDYSGVTVGDLNNTNLTTSSVVINQASPQFAFLRFAVTGATQYRPYFVSGSGGGYIGISAEL